MQDLKKILSNRYISTNWNK